MTEAHAAFSFSFLFLPHEPLRLPESRAKDRGGRQAVVGLLIFRLELK